MSNIYEFGTPAETDDADNYIDQQKGKFKSVIMIGLDEDDEPVFGQTE